MFFRKQTKIAWLIGVLTLLQIVFCVRVVDADLQVSPHAVAYNEFLYLARRAYLMHLDDPNETEILEEVIEKSRNFHLPSHYRFAATYNRGKAEMLLGRVDAAITTFEELTKDIPSDSDRYVSSIFYYRGDVLFRWNPFERGLLDLGLAYDKTRQHAKADATYQKLITHPKFSEGLEARLAREILEFDKTSRIGEIPAVHSAWIGMPAPQFGIEDELHKKFYDLRQYSGKVVLLYIGKTDALNLKPIHEKYKDKHFQIISVNVKQHDLSLLQGRVKKTGAWLHYNTIDGKIIDTFQVRSLPSLFLIDSEGIVRRTHIDATVLEKAVDEMVRENLATYHDPRMKEIIAETLTAHGGREKIVAVKNFVVNKVSVVHSPASGPHSERDENAVKVYYYRDKYSFYKYHRNYVFDGSAFYMKGLVDEEWYLMNQRNKHRSPAYGKSVLFHQPIWLLQTLAEDKIPVQYVGTEPVNGEPTSVLRVRQPWGAPLKIFISEKTHTLTQLIFVDPRDDTISITSFDWYKEVDGIKIPYFTKEGLLEENFIHEITFNAEIDPKLFNMKK
ncbi:MAG: TlpA disulfide reductase family protein [Candidatus Poribacteria bacterium]|nr:TlpA disulfide reductase family protein [Candidatus Poribacteria bacterium]